MKSMQIHTLENNLMKSLTIKTILFSFIVIFFLSTQLYAQNIRKMYKYFEKNDIENAVVEYRKFTKEVANVPLDYALYGIAGCIILNSEKTAKYDPYRALDIFENTSKINADKAEVDKFLAKYSLSREKVHEAIYQNILKVAKTKNNIESYDKALGVCNQCFYEKEVIKLKEIAYYNKAKTDKSVSILNNFISSYPNSEYLIEIKQILYQEAFINAKSKLTVEAFNDYIKDYSTEENKFLFIAKQLRDSLVLENKRLTYLKFREAYFNLLIEYLQSKQTSNYYLSIPATAYSDGLVFHKPTCYGCAPYIFVKLNNNGERIKGAFSANSDEFIDIGSTGLNERFRISRIMPIMPYRLSTDFYTVIGMAFSESMIERGNMSPPNEFLTFEKFDLLSNDTIFILKQTQLIKYKLTDLIGKYDYQERNPVKGFKKLSNGNILVVFQLNYQYLSYRMSNAFGINGTNSPSRVIETQKSYKFLVFSEDGSKIISSADYLLPIDHIVSVDDGFIVTSSKIGVLININSIDELTVKKVYDYNSQKNIKILDAKIEYKYDNLADGVQFFKFDNDGKFIFDKVIEKIENPSIRKPDFYGVQGINNKLYLFYTSYQSSVVNEAAHLLLVYDKNGNEISKTNISSISNPYGDLININGTLYLREDKILVKVLEP